MFQLLAIYMDGLQMYITIQVPSVKMVCEESGIGNQEIGVGFQRSENSFAPLTIRASRFPIPDSRSGTTLAEVNSLELSGAGCPVVITSKPLSDSRQPTADSPILHIIYMESLCFFNT
jgi:hypothetical protein